MAMPHGDGTRSWSSVKPGSCTEVAGAVGVPAPTAYTPARSTSAYVAYSWPPYTTGTCASCPQLPIAPSTSVSVVDVPEAGQLK
jgi:hypothetical protein